MGWLVGGGWDWEGFGRGNSLLDFSWLTSSSFSFLSLLNMVGGCVYNVCLETLSQMTATAVAGSAPLSWPWTSSASNPTPIRTSASWNSSAWEQRWPSCPLKCSGWAVSLGNKRWQEASRYRPPQRWEAWKAWLGHCQMNLCTLLQMAGISKEIELCRTKAKNNLICQTLRIVFCILYHWSKIQLELDSIWSWRSLRSLAFYDMQGILTSWQIHSYNLSGLHNIVENCWTEKVGNSFFIFLPLSLVFWVFLF